MISLKPTPDSPHHPLDWRVHEMSVSTLEPESMPRSPSPAEMAAPASGVVTPIPAPWDSIQSLPLPARGWGRSTGPACGSSSPNSREAAGPLEPSQTLLLAEPVGKPAERARSPHKRGQLSEQCSPAFSHMGSTLHKVTKVLLAALLVSVTNNTR